MKTQTVGEVLGLFDLSRLDLSLLRYRVGFQPEPGEDNDDVERVGAGMTIIDNWLGAGRFTCWFYKGMYTAHLTYGISRTPEGWIPIDVYNSDKVAIYYLLKNS